MFSAVEEWIGKYLNEIAIFKALREAGHLSILGLRDPAQRFRSLPMVSYLTVLSARTATISIYERFSSNVAISVHPVTRSV